MIDERVFPSLGVLKVAAELEGSGHRVDVLDLSGRADMERRVFEHVYQQWDQITVYGITATMPQMPSAVRIAQTLRQFKPEAKLILGGPHATLVNASARRETVPGRATRMLDELRGLFDVIVCGDGERAVHQALTAEPGTIIDADNPASSLFLDGPALNEAPFPARHLIDIASYKYAIDGVQAQSMIAQLGCPFGCAFCGGRRSPFLRRVRRRSSQRVVDEMLHLYETYGTRGFMFLDDELNVNPSFMELLGAIQDAQHRLGVEFRLRGLLKSELVTEPMAQAMYQAGFREVLIGFESGHPRILENMQKHATVEDNTRCMDILRRNGIGVKALMSFGHPGESEETCKATEDWLLQVQPDNFDVTIITVYPGTPYFEDAVATGQDIYTYTAKNGDRLHMLPVDQFSDVNFYKGIPQNYQSFVFTDFLSSEQLVHMRDQVEDNVRKTLGLAYPTTMAELQFEHSMGAQR